MLASATTQCTKSQPCRRSGPCTRCTAAAILTRGDWFAIDFYRLVADQANANGLPNFTAYQVVLNAQDYPSHLHGWLLQTAGLLHRLLAKIETVDWLRETGKPYRLITREDVTDGH